MVEPAGTPKAPQHSNPESDTRKVMASGNSGNPAGKLPDVVHWRNAWIGPRGPRESTTVLVLHTLANHMDRHGKDCFPGVVRIARESRLSERAVQKHLRIAEAAGWLSIQRAQRRPDGKDPNRYLPTLPEAAATGAPGASEEAETPAPRAPHPRTTCTPPVHQVHPSSSVSSPSSRSISPLPPAAPAASPAARASNDGGGEEVGQRVDSELQPHSTENELLAEAERQLAAAPPELAAALQREAATLARKLDHPAWVEFPGVVVTPATRLPIFAAALHRVVTGEAPHGLFGSLRYVRRSHTQPATAISSATPGTPLGVFTPSGTPTSRELLEQSRRARDVEWERRAEEDAAGALATPGGSGRQSAPSVRRSMAAIRETLGQPQIPPATAAPSGSTTTAASEPRRPSRSVA